MQNYSQAVPAVQKTIAVLEYLRTQSAPTLTEMSQALAINRSTLLAILNTLRAAAIVRRDDQERYHLGPGLLSYACSSAQSLSPVQACSGPAEWLVETMGESVAVLAPSDGQMVVVDFKVGGHDIGALIELGRRYPMGSSAAGLALLAAGDQITAAGGIRAEPESRLDEIRSRGYAALPDERETGQVSLAAPVCDAGGEPVAALALVGPAFRLNEGRSAEAGRSLLEAAERASLALGCRSYRPYGDQRRSSATWQGSHSAGLHGADLETFLSQPWVASLACLNELGYPYTVPVWYEWRGGAFWLVPRARSRWVSFIRAHPQVSMTISEPAPPFRRVLVEGKAAELGPAGAGAAKDILQRLAQRYLGREAASYTASAASRGESVIRIEPDKITSWEGLVAHPRYRGVA